MSDKQYKPYPDSGSLRASQTKKGPKSPDYWGTIAINLKDLTNIHTEDGLTIVKLSGWKKQDSQGRTFLSIAVDRFVPEQKGAPARQSRKDEDFGNDDVPF
jgi:hypothetical protein